MAEKTKTFEEYKKDIEKDLRHKGFFFIDDGIYELLNEECRNGILEILSKESYVTDGRKYPRHMAEDRQGNLVFFIYDEIKYNTPVRVTKISEFLDKLFVYGFTTLNRYFRGQKAKYDLRPMLFREKEWVQREMELNNRMYNERPHDFADCNCTFDKLVKLKHYEHPSRLLDLTANPLIALFFACFSSSGENDKDTGIVYEAYCENEKEKISVTSDTVVMLTAMTNTRIGIKGQEYKVPCFEKREVPGNNLPGKLVPRACGGSCLSICRHDKKLGRILSRKKSFITYITELRHQCKKEGMTIYWDDLCYNELNQCILVRPPLNNDRITRQQGCFIMCGMNPENIYEPPEDLYRFFTHPRKDKKATFYYILPEDKSLILRKLKIIGIDEYYIFPELERGTKVLSNSMKKSKSDDGKMNDVSTNHFLLTEDFNSFVERKNKSSQIQIESATLDSLEEVNSLKS